MNKVYLVKMADGRDGYLAMINQECYGLIATKDQEPVPMQGTKRGNDISLMIDGVDYDLTLNRSHNFEDIYTIGDFNTKFMGLVDFAVYNNDTESIDKLHADVLKDFHNIIAGYLDEAERAVTK